MKSRSLLLSLAACALGAASLVGCGGGGGGSVANRTAQLSLFATDSFREDFDHVWATIFKVELIKQDGFAAIAFSDPKGISIDLKNLRDASGTRFSFLGTAAVSDDVYAGARVTIAPALTLILRGGTTGTPTTVAASVPRDSQGNPLISLDFAAPRHLGNDDVIIDFDLASFVISGGKVTPRVKEGQRNGLDNPARHERDEHEGVVNGLSGVSPNFTFTIQKGSNAPITVATDATTVIFTSGSQTSVALANGQRVEVRGAFDSTANVLRAVSVKIENEQENEDAAELLGVPSNVDAVGGAFSMTAVKVKGFVPAQTTVRVTTSTATRFRGQRGVSTTAAAFFGALRGSPAVEAEGTYDAATNTLSASSVKLEAEDGHHSGDDGGNHGGHNGGGDG